MYLFAGWKSTTDQHQLEVNNNNYCCYAQHPNMHFIMSNKLKSTQLVIACDQLLSLG